MLTVDWITRPQQPIASVKIQCDEGNVRYYKCANYEPETCCHHLNVNDAIRQTMVGGPSYADRAAQLRVDPRNLGCDKARLLATWVVPERDFTGFTAVGI